MFWRRVIICLVGFASVVLGEGIAVNQNVSGVYNYVSVKDLLRIQPADPFFLSLVCPKTLIVNTSHSQGEASIMLVAETEESSKCFFTSNESSVSAQVRFQVYSLDSGPESDSNGGKISLLDLTNQFPLLGGNIVNAQLECALLNRTISNAQVVAQDMGFFYSLLNHYRDSGQELGMAFSEIERSSLAPVAHTFSVNVALDSTDGIGCSYLREEDERRLRTEVQSLTEPENTTVPQAEASPIQTQEATEKSDESTCFPGAARVKVANGSLVPMSELREGDEVLDGDGSFSKVLMFTHSDAEARWEFVRLTTRRGSVVATHSHYIYANGRLKTAGKVEVGDTLRVVGVDGAGKGSAEERVMRKQTVQQRGLFNPQTASGRLVVFWDGDGVRCSAYTSSVAPRVAHALLAPLRWLAPMSRAVGHRLIGLPSRFFA